MKKAVGLVVLFLAIVFTLHFINTDAQIRWRGFASTARRAYKADSLRYGSSYFHGNSYLRSDVRDTSTAPLIFLGSLEIEGCTLFMWDAVISDWGAQRSTWDIKDHKSTLPYGWSFDLVPISGNNKYINIGKGSFDCQGVRIDTLGVMWWGLGATCTDTTWVDGINGEIDFQTKVSGGRILSDTLRSGITLADVFRIGQSNGKPGAPVVGNVIYDSTGTDSVFIYMGSGNWRAIADDN